MRVVVAGLGVQGHKRRRIAGADFVTDADPKNPEAKHRRLEDIPAGSYDAALLCVPDDAKLDLIDYLIQNKKHALVEKPLIGSEQDLKRLEANARERGLFIYTAYNHRFEPHFVRMRDLLRAGTLGKIYHCRMFYGNGTARLVRDSEWRDTGAGVLPDLGSHLIDTLRFWFDGWDGAPCDAVSGGWLCQWDFAAGGDEEEEKKREGCEGEDVSQGLVEGLGMVDVDGGGAGREVEGDEAVVSLEAIGDRGSVELDAPGGVVAEIEDEIFGFGGVEGEACGCWAGDGVGGGFGVGVGCEPVGWVGGGERIVVGVGWGVLVGGFGALVGLEEGEAGLYGVFFVAGLVEDGVGGVG